MAFKSLSWILVAALATISRDTSSQIPSELNLAASAAKKAGGMGVLDRLDV